MQSNDLTLETGYLCLDFANTADWHASQHPTEHLNSYEDLMAWARQVGLVTEPEGQYLLRQAAQRSGEVVTVLEQAIALREAIYRIFSATGNRHQPDSADMATLNQTLTEALRHLQIVPVEAGFAWAWAGNSETLDKILWPIARSAAELLTSERLDRVKECEDDRGCGYLFFDTSRNRSRRWCDMRGCGNRAKVRRHRRRK